ncbi:MAG: hypothetical protein IPH23_02550 [Gammaproteobacteria bacterium]|nr:hypothetical protein [Gammaproteobacteria bacterium]
MGLAIALAFPVFRAHLLPALPQPLAILRWRVQETLTRFNRRRCHFGLQGRGFETTPAVFDMPALLSDCSSSCRIGGRDARDRTFHRLPLATIVIARSAS